MIFKTWRVRRNCFHHDRISGESWVRSQLINTGMGKMFWCDFCGKTWFV